MLLSTKNMLAFRISSPRFLI